MVNAIVYALAAIGVRTLAVLCGAVYIGICVPNLEAVGDQPECHTIGGFDCGKFDISDDWYNPAYGYNGGDLLGVVSTAPVWQLRLGGKFYTIRELMGREI